METSRLSKGNPQLFVQSTADHSYKLYILVPCSLVFSETGQEPTRTLFPKRALNPTHGVLLFEIVQDTIVEECTKRATTNYARNIFMTRGRMGTSTLSGPGRSIHFAVLQIIVRTLASSRHTFVLSVIICISSDVMCSLRVSENLGA